MQLIEIQEMPIEQLKAQFDEIMSSVVTQYGDNKDDRESAESTDTKAEKV